MSGLADEGGARDSPSSVLPKDASCLGAYRRFSDCGLARGRHPIVVLCCLGEVQVLGPSGVCGALRRGAELRRTHTCHLCAKSRSLDCILRISARHGAEEGRLAEEDAGGQRRGGREWRGSPCADPRGLRQARPYGEQEAVDTACLRLSGCCQAALVLGKAAPIPLFLLRVSRAGGVEASSRTEGQSTE